MNIRHWELIKEANEFLKEHYNMELDIPIEFNNRLKRSLGRFQFAKSKLTGKLVPRKIELSTEFVKVHPRENILDVLRHELVHYVLCRKGLSQAQFADGHPIFESELRKLGISRTNTYTTYGKVHEYECDSCGAEWQRKIKIPKTSRCSCSVFSNIVYKGEFELDHNGEYSENLSVASKIEGDSHD